MNKIKIGIGSCLLGNKVRFDGQHKHDRFITDTLGKWCEFVPVCPEVECGLSIPRESMRLVGTKDKYRLLTNKSLQDITPGMLSWAERRLDGLEKEDLVAFIFKAKSPASSANLEKLRRKPAARTLTSQEPATSGFLSKRLIIKKLQLRTQTFFSI